jgi:DNA-binding response OmpR family regulator
LLIVLADKDPYDLQALQAALQGPDREVLIVEDGGNVVTLAQARSPDVVVVGSSLGQMGGFAVSRELKMLAEMGMITQPKVVVLLEREADSWLAAWSHCDVWRVKPVDFDEIERIVEGFVGQPAA